ncbi:MAG: hypothetical protein M1814_000973 [Vezdaea aestivalis]|nr:MAG: hypothetical protein M1814_000973 [Vezdaea aestivalis]
MAARIHEPNLTTKVQQDDMAESSSKAKSLSDKQDRISTKVDQNSYIFDSENQSSTVSSLFSIGKSPLTWADSNEGLLDIAIDLLTCEFTAHTQIRRDIEAISSNRNQQNKRRNISVLLEVLNHELLNSDKSAGQHLSNLLNKKRSRKKLATSLIQRTRYLASRSDAARDFATKLVSEPLSSDSSSEEENEEGQAELKYHWAELKAAKQLIKVGDAIERFKEELQDLAHPFRDTSLWSKRIVLRDEIHPVYFLHPESVEVPTLFDMAKLIVNYFIDTRIRFLSPKVSIVPIK